MRTRILKFGGSSLTGIDQIEAAGERVADALSAGLRPIVVVSAMAGSTNRLLSTARRLHAEPPGDELDRLLATGESQAASLMAIALQQRGIQARSFTGGGAGLVTDDCFRRARILEVNTGPLMAALEAGEVPVVPGFQGVTQDGRVTTLGRGGSDITAVALARAHGADRVVFFRDVEGIHTTDPKLLERSRRMDEVDYSSLMDLAEAGAPILHPQAVETARAQGLELEVRSLARGSASTFVRKGGTPTFSPVWSISVSRPVSILTIERLARDVGVVSQLVALLERTDLQVEGVLSTAPSKRLNMTCLIPDIDGPAVHAQLEDFLREENDLIYHLERRRCRVTLVGKGVSSRRVSRALELVGDRLGPPLATFRGRNHRAFVIPEPDGKAWLGHLHHDLIRS